MWVEHVLQKWGIRMDASHPESLEQLGQEVSPVRVVEPVNKEAHLEHEVDEPIEVQVENVLPVSMLPQVYHFDNIFNLALLLELLSINLEI